MFSIERSHPSLKGDIVKDWKYIVNVLKTVFSLTTELVSTELGKKYQRVEEIQICSNASLWRPCWTWGGEESIISISLEDDANFILPFWGISRQHKTVICFHTFQKWMNLFLHLIIWFPSNVVFLNQNELN